MELSFGIVVSVVSCVLWVVCCCLCETLAPIAVEILFIFSLKIKRLERIAGNSFENLSIFINRFKKKPLLIKVTAWYWLIANHYFLCLGSEDTVNLCLPFALRRARTFLPFAEAILSINPCLFLLFLFDGWNVLLLIVCYL